MLGGPAAGAGGRGGGGLSRGRAPCRAVAAERRGRFPVNRPGNRPLLLLLACLAVARLSAPYARQPGPQRSSGVAVAAPARLRGFGGPPPRHRELLLVLRGGGGEFKYMEDPSRARGPEEAAEADSGAIGSSTLEDEYLLSGAAGDDEDHVLSSLPVHLLFTCTDSCFASHTRL